MCYCVRGCDGMRLWLSCSGKGGVKVSWGCAREMLAGTAGEYFLILPLLFMQYCVWGPRKSRMVNSWQHCWSYTG